MLRGIVPAIPTPMTAGENVDEASLRRVVQYQLDGGVHGLWVLGTTGRFDLVQDRDQRATAETVCQTVQGRVPVVLHVSDLGTARTLQRAAGFDDLPIDAYAVMPPWFDQYERGELLDHFRRLADELSRPLVIYSADWICNVLPLSDVRELARHPRVIAIKDTNPEVGRWRSWPAEKRETLGFSYLHGTDQIAAAANAGADGVVSGLAGLLPALAVEIWEAAGTGNAARALALQEQFSSVGRLYEIGSAMACLEAAYQYLGLCGLISGSPQRSATPALRQEVGSILLQAGIGSYLAGTRDPGVNYRTE